MRALRSIVGSIVALGLSFTVLTGFNQRQSALIESPAIASVSVAQVEAAPLSQGQMAAVSGDGWWEAILGALVGAAVGGPWGAVVGFVVGSQVDADYICVEYENGRNDCVYMPVYGE